MVCLYILNIPSPLLRDVWWCVPPGTSKRDTISNQKTGFSKVSHMYECSLRRSRKKGATTCLYSTIGSTKFAIYITSRLCRLVLCILHTMLFSRKKRMKMPWRMMKVVWQILSAMSYPEITSLYFHNSKKSFWPCYFSFLAKLIDLLVPFLAKS